MKIKKIVVSLVAFLFVICFSVGTVAPMQSNASEEDLEYYTVYNSETNDVLFLKGDNVYVGDEYISADNKRYVIEAVDGEEKTGKAKFVENVKMPVFNIKKAETDLQSVSAANSKKIGIYHTHNDECYDDADGTDSIYGKGGIHDVGKKFKEAFEKLGIEVYYSENLHLPHDSGAYQRSLPTATTLLENGLDALFDVHRDATPRKEYITEVDGVTMSKVRMVVGSANQNSAVNKEFALTIKAYADEVYPGLIKDIYIGKGNYNQQLYSKAMLFEFGTNTIEKSLVLKSCEPLAKTLDVVLFGTQGASKESLKDIDTTVSTGGTLETGLVGQTKTTQTKAGLSTLWIVLISVGGVLLVFGLVMLISPTARQKTGRFFSELFGGLFKRKNKTEV